MTLRLKIKDMEMNERIVKWSHEVIFNRCSFLGVIFYSVYGDKRLKLRKINGIKRLIIIKVVLIYLFVLSSHFYLQSINYS